MRFIQEYFLLFIYFSQQNSIISEIFSHTFHPIFFAVDFVSFSFTKNGNCSTIIINGCRNRQDRPENAARKLLAYIKQKGQLRLPVCMKIEGVSLGISDMPINKRSILMT